MFHDKWAFVVDPFQHHMFAFVLGERVRLAGGIGEGEVGCGFAWLCCVQRGLKQGKTCDCEKAKFFDHNCGFCLVTVLVS